MTCPACADPNSGRVTAGCRGCAIIELARGPLFFQSMWEGRLTPEYRLALRALGDEVEVHAEVKACAKRCFTGATRA